MPGRRAGRRPRGARRAAPTRCRPRRPPAARSCSVPKPTAVDQRASAAMPGRRSRARVGAAARRARRRAIAKTIPAAVQRRQRVCRSPGRTATERGADGRADPRDDDIRGSGAGAVRTLRAPTTLPAPRDARRAAIALVGRGVVARRRSRAATGADERGAGAARQAPVAQRRAAGRAAGRGRSPAAVRRSGLAERQDDDEHGEQAGNLGRDDRAARRADRGALRRRRARDGRPRGHRRPPALRGGRPRVPPARAGGEARRASGAARRSDDEGARELLDEGEDPRCARCSTAARARIERARGGDPPRDGRARPQRRQERDRRDPGRRGRRRGRAVGRRPVPHAHQVRRAARLHDRAAGGRRRQVHVRHQGRRRVLGLQVRGRHAPRAARAGDRVAGPHPHLDGDGRGAARGRGRRRRRRPERPADRRLPLLGARRAVGQHDRLGGAHHAQAERHRRLDAGREVPAAEPREGDARAARAAVRAGARRAAGRARRRPPRRRSAPASARRRSAPTTSASAASPTTASSSRTHNLDAGARGRARRVHRRAAGRREAPRLEEQAGAAA